MKKRKTGLIVILTILIGAFLISPNASLREMLVAQEIYYRGEYIITTYYPAPFGRYQEIETKGNTYLATESGNVGIGTKAPWWPLHVHNPNSAIIELTTDSTGSGASDGLRIEEGVGGAGSLDAQIFNQENGYLRFGTNATERVRIDNVGNVGIGTTDPEFKLNLDNDGGIIAKGTFGGGNSLSTSGVGTRLIWYPKKAAFRAGYVGSDKWDDTNIGDYSVAMGWEAIASGKCSFAMGSEIGATGEASSAFGTWTTANGFASMAIGQGATAAGKNSTAIGYCVTVGGPTDIYGPPPADVKKNNFVIGSGWDWFHKMANNINNSLMIGFMNSETDDMPEFFVKDGAVGIGTTSPQGTLDVNGTIYQRGGLLHADYVFEPSYNLESIEKHASYMWKEKRLPSLPKAQLDESGKQIVELGATQRGILEELEKAHIYIEQLNKLSKAQQKEIDGMKEEMRQLKKKK